MKYEQPLDENIKKKINLVENLLEFVLWIKLRLLELFNEIFVKRKNMRGYVDKTFVKHTN